MNKKYPVVSGYRRKPKKDMDGSKNYGKPCVFCGVGTCGEVWVQMSYMRGEDETARVCLKRLGFATNTGVKQVVKLLRLI